MGWHGVVGNDVLLGFVLTGARPLQSLVDAMCSLLFAFLAPHPLPPLSFENNFSSSPDVSTHRTLELTP